MTVTGNDVSHLSAVQVPSDVPAPYDDGHAIRPVATLHIIRVALLGCVVAPPRLQFSLYRQVQGPQNSELSGRPIMERCLLCDHWNNHSAGYVVYLSVTYLMMPSIAQAI
jgi:hypothetical protein